MSADSQSGPTKPTDSTDSADAAQPTESIQALDADLVARLDSAVAFIARQYVGTVRLADIARVSHLSPYHFHRLFRRQYGKTPRQMIEELRIAEVQRLLLARLSAREASRRAGFAHHSHMATRFKRFVGITPQRWVERARAAQARPVVDADGSDGVELVASAPRAPLVRPALRVLVVEDDPDGRDILVRLLIGAGHAVESAVDAVTALAAAARRPPDVLVSDIALPGMDGCELMQTMRGRYRTPGIALTALPDDERHSDRCRAAGFTHFLCKPVKLAAVLDAIAAAGARRDN